MRILIKRTGALGDVVLTLPVIQWYVANGYEVDVMCAQQVASIFNNSPYAKVVLRPEGEYDKIIDLNLAYEKRPKMHIVEAYAQECGIDPAELKQPEMFPDEQISYAPMTIIHAARSWKNRTMSDEFWFEVAKRMPSVCGFVGSKGDYGFQDDSLGIVDLRGILSLGEIQSMISVAQYFVGMDSGLLHVASTTNTPIVGIFTSAKAQYRKPWGRSKFVAVEANVDCYGCLHEQAPPVTFCDCPQNRNYECVKSITPDDLLKIKLEDLCGF